MKIIINYNQIKYQTDRAYLIGIPDSTGKFWISSKMVYTHGNQLSVLLPDNWDYQIIRGKHGQEKETVDISYMEEHFANQIAPTVEHHRPKKLDVDDKIDDSLIK